ncbi:MULTISPECIES: hypothetical protein [unclassified Thiomonas]|uniref:hypothetical protein n=1 Tax=unclassified Thiomonas TaxID=2625466 RepID=UPI0004DBC64F|nr:MULTISPECIES: hypothetical protein [unclassified Thiomonas]CDW96337.1 exported hypothetical protein [Thiomonas sp. CB2]VDY06736.1 exported protein of unknown function [Thiomonas sp. Bio17B3]VDY09970.1 exported protein of unknown function [Thiomonas sp. Sup16B3]VDY11213.1 exported protein of unknown function [Thiomonas sp. Sup16B3]VDY11248.1 exported protein of unknown function [Thiomonas sp. Bio17B3]
MKITIIKLLPLSLAIAALAGCHQGGVGVDSGASQKAATTLENGLQSDRSIHSSTSAQASIHMPASALALQAFTSFGKQAFLPPAGPASSPEQTQLASIIWAGSMESPTKIDEPASAQTMGAISVAAMAYPWQGWPYSCFGCSKEATWARGMAQRVVFSNTILSQILPKLSARTLADPNAAQVAIISEYKKIPAAQLVAAYNQAGQQVQGGINFDFSGSQPAPVHFMIGNNDFQASPTGWKWSMAGVPWFGEGRISGKDMELSLASAIDKSQGQSSGTGSSTSTDTEQGVSGSVGVK